MSLSFRAGGSTVIGIHPSLQANEEHLLLAPELGLFAVFGDSGVWSELPDRAGRVSAEVIQRVIREDEGEPQTLIEQAFRSARENIREDHAKHDDSSVCAATSVVLALLRSGRVFVSWLGATMAHRVTSDRIEPLTQPHTEPREFIRQVRLSWLSHGPLEVISFSPLPGDRLVLTTDGVADHIPESTILNVCRTISDPTTCAEAIIEHAIMAGSRDNCTCAVIVFGKEELS